MTTTWAPTYGPLLATRTREVYGQSFDRHIGSRLGHLALHAITPPVLARWQTAELAAGPEALRKARIVLSAILQTAVEAGLIAANPVRSVRAPKAPTRDETRPLAPLAVEALRAELGHRDAVLVSLLAYAGLRPGEARELRWGHVGERTLVVNAAKTGRRRTVRLLDPLRADLLVWRMASGRPADDAPVIPRPSDGAVMSARSFNDWRGATFAPALAAAGLSSARPYDLRHSFASLLLHEGRSVVDVARQLGHGANLTLSTYGPSLTSSTALRTSPQRTRFAPLARAMFARRSRSSTLPAENRRVSRTFPPGGALPV